MERAVTCALLLLSCSAAFSKYVYIKDGETWHGAQNYCRQFHTDLATVSHNRDMWKIWWSTNHTVDFFWIGLRRNSTDREKWTWSGGGEVFTFFWGQDQPENREDEDYGLMQYMFWHDSRLGSERPFICYKAIVVRERKTWMEALEYCRKHHQDLASVASETEMLLIKNELGKNETTAHAWIGLHFFSGNWLWVDGEEMSYEVWGPEGKPACPKARQQCAAIKVVESGQASQSTNATLVTIATVGPVVYNAGSGALDIFGTAAAGVKKHVWEARDCEESLYFICY